MMSYSLEDLERAAEENLRKQARKPAEHRLTHT